MPPGEPLQSRAREALLRDPEDGKAAARVESRVRVAISLFILVLIVVSAAGWMWTGAHQTTAQAAASRTVLTLGVLAGVSGLWVLWRKGSAT